MKYTPEPVGEGEYVKWDVQFEGDGGGFIFHSQGNAIIFCLLLEIRDLLKDQKSKKRIGKTVKLESDPE